MVIIPLVPTAAQNLSTVLVPGSGFTPQDCRIAVAQKFYGLFLDLYVSEVLVAGGVICQNRNALIREASVSFIGELFFLDNQGSSDPVYTGLGTRWQLCYLSLEDIIAINIAAGASLPTVSGFGNIGGVTGGGGAGAGGGGGGGGGTGGGGGGGLPSGPGAPTQFNPTTGAILPWSATVSAEFNGYELGARVLAVTPVKPGQQYWASRQDNNTNNPDTSPPSPDGTYGGWKVVGH